MAKNSREFQIFTKPIGPRCNLACSYCYYLEKENLYPDSNSFRMPYDLLESYIIQHIDASTEPIINFSWHGGEPTLLGLDYFRKIVELQHKHKPANRLVRNGLQTNGTLLNDEWCRFFKAEDFFVGISIDGPAKLHDVHRLNKSRKPTHAQTIRGYELLQRHGVTTEILCVVNSLNVHHALAVYEYFRQLETKYISFLPLVEPPDVTGRPGPSTVPAPAFGDFLVTIFEAWQSRDIGEIKIQIFEEAARTAFGQDHTLCIFKETCGGVPVVEFNGDFYSCDHFVDKEHYLGNIKQTPLAELLDSPEQREFGHNKLALLPQYCRSCEVRAMCNGGCPKNRFIRTPDGEAGLNYLCDGYKRFFRHCLPFITEVARLWQQQQHEKQETAASNRTPKIGRNDPCPCGSGKKYKNCCLKSGWGF